ncbi:nucleoside-diphosphate sugar epimerase/dehydratase [Hydrogenimonas thermophila]|uniref:polysaccharide biosynthesis protein n=1 Tax=Hydrogenimonas thermophila TaxID=223786 RepID=UPI0029371BEA|nr:nucleoside-diphosphate sugar epimerase/dehydratase [Hydrogenimonas thermophila]WOE70117.1 nucleoside-diphosphate sugar epimerase/dehydratase [Hydrogenimonas thermophila]WOE72634.1 nucleoside-diphosphate sugar epimerase/dehydratase [Hydrogenimonas thermophila]
MLIEKLFRPSILKRTIFFIFADILLFALSFYLSYLFRLGFYISSEFYAGFYNALPLLIGLKLLMLYLLKIYHVVWRFFSLTEAKKLIFAIFMGNLIFAILFLPFVQVPFPRSVILIDFFISAILVGGFRISKRLLLETKRKPGLKRALIIGANSKASNLIKSFLSNEIEYYPVGIITDKDKMVGTYLSNIKIHGFDKLKTLIDTFKVNSVIITEDYSSKELDNLFEMLSELGIKEIKIARLLGDKEDKLKDIAIEDLLARKPKDLDTSAIQSFIKGKKVLITGAGGSIGSEIARQCKVFGAKQLILVESSEYNLYKICEDLDSKIAVPKLLSVLERDKLDSIFEELKPDIVIHAAAYKHVPLCESNIDSAVKNNILGAINVIDISIKHSVEKIVNISSDKAVRPTNVMGATKRVTELYAQNVPSGKTEIVSVRFGNVLGSSGSVVPKFKEQIQNGGPVTVTHPEITRYFMLIPEACQLVLQAGAMAKGGELFILDMGEPVKIVDLARKMIRLYGKEGEVEIEFTGLRPGEKLYEELLIDEAECRTKYESIYVAKPTEYPIEKLRENIEELLNSDDKIAALKKIVPEFNHRD